MDRIFQEFPILDGDKAKASFGFATSDYLKTDERIFYLEDLSPPADWNLYLTQPKTPDLLPLEIGKQIFKTT
ncbi:hypothetical protein LEP1GSC046_3563 [Leptospira kirschneri serovar Bim str. 1051]|nr:hypothetical protein LEP1GSC042_3778 [Leptospira kirschneri serovar Bim str. PUO 1247]EMN04972.1 hypothetical protein LEP1GSC046_3563 [Leptospira kirschneri serovar Bim str. 1051]